MLFISSSWTAHRKLTRVHVHVEPAKIFRIRFRPLDRRDAVSWVEMDCQQKEWSKEVSKEQYLSYVALEVVLLLYTYVLIRDNTN